MGRTIEKNGRYIAVQEFSQKWRVTTTRSGVAVPYDVPKKDYPTFDDLKDYVLKEPLF